MTTLRNRLLGLAASITLLAMLAGLPVLLLATTPSYVPAIGNWADLGGFLASPDDGTLAWLGVWAFGWIVWVVLATLIVTELIATFRGVRTPKLRAISWPQHMVASLVATAALLFVAAPTLGALPGTVAVAQPTRTSPLMGAPSTGAQAAATESSTVDYVVQRGDSLWRIAERHLGDGNRYPEIVELNAKLLKRGPSFIREGWTLKLPAPSADGDRTHTVRKGDTLSAIALKELGHASQWPKIAAASRSIIQPDGRRLTDPDEIDIGWTLRIPSGEEARPDEQPEPKPRSGSTPAPTTATVPGPTSSTPAPAAPGSVTPSPSTVAPLTTPAETGQPAPVEVAQPVAEGEDVQPPWMLIGITGGGALLAGGLWRVLKRRRVTQLRHRRPGRRPVGPPPELVPVERSIHLAASTGAEDLIKYLDTALKDLGSLLAFGNRPMPKLSAIQLDTQGITLHLAEPVDFLVEPWTGEAAQWLLPAAALPALGPSEQVAPYPLLVTVGKDDAGRIWLINPEQYATITISGDPSFAEDLIRSITAEIGVHPWAEDARAECIGVAAEVQSLNPARIHHHDEPTQISATLAAAVDHASRLDQTAASDTPTARATDAGLDVWHGHLIILSRQHAALAKPLRDLIAGQPGRTGTAVVLLGAYSDDDSRLHLNLTSGGRLTIPELGLDLLPVGITTDEASGFASLLSDANTLADAPIRVDTAAEVGWESLADDTGSIREDFTIDRDEPDQSDKAAVSVLPEPDAAYLSAAATTADDLARLAPKIPAEVTNAVMAADPTLDADLADWNDPASARPKLRVLGPVTVELKDGGEPAIVGTSKGSYVELLAFLATRTRGATTHQVADAIRIDPSRVRGTVSKLRDWLGTDPTTGEHYLPLMHESAATKASGTGAYELKGVLVDADLFRRLHLRGKTRGPEGLEDLKFALTLVTGEPLTGFHDNRGNWVYDGDRLDQQYIVAIADVAHIVATAALAAGDPLGARAAALVALKASPAEEISRLDFERSGGDLGGHAQFPESPFSDSEDWPGRTREVKGAPSKRLLGHRAVG